MIVAGSSEPEMFRIAVQQFRGVPGGDRFLTAEGTLSYLALVDGEVAGRCCGQHMIRPDQASMIYLHELEVAEPYRRRGIGRALVQSVIEAGRDLGATKMFLTTGEANLAARAPYEQLGAGLAAQGPTVNYWFPLRS